MAARVFLVDDEELLTESMEIILTVRGGMEVVGMAKDGKEALERLSEVTADIALVDLNMKGMGGLELIPILKERYPAMKILVLTTFYDDKYITEAIAGGADGYLLKDSAGDTIIHAVEQILSGQSILAGKVLDALSRMMLQRGTEDAAGSKMEGAGKEEAGARDTGEVKKGKKAGTGDAVKGSGKGNFVVPGKLPKDLTARELEVCGLLSLGCTNSEIARRLFLAEGTVKNYMMTIYDKFDIHDRTTLVLFLKELAE